MVGDDKKKRKMKRKQTTLKLKNYSINFYYFLLQHNSGKSQHNKSTNFYLSLGTPRYNKYFPTVGTSRTKVSFTYVLILNQVNFNASRRLFTSQMKVQLQIDRQRMPTNRSQIGRYLLPTSPTNGGVISVFLRREPLPKIAQENSYNFQAVYHVFS